MSDAEKSQFKKLTSFNYYVEQEELMREYQIGLAQMRIVRRKLSDCVKSETVNQFVNCRDLREQYHTMCKDNFNGMKFPSGQEPHTRKTPGLVSHYYKQIVAE